MATAYAEYAGVKLPLWTPDCDAALARANLDLSRFQQFNHAPDETVLNGLPLPPRPYPPSPRGGSLWWPTGASQFARAHFVVDTATLTAIRSQLVTDAGSSTAGYVAADLILDDGLGGAAVETAMHFLPPLPLVGSEDLYLVTLVDERFYWWFRPTISLSAVTTWSGLYSSLGTGIGSTVTVDGSLSSFAAPSSRWATLGTAPLPLLLDAAAWCTGRRIVRQLDGTVKATDYATAKSAAATVRSGWGTTYRRRGGGVVIDSDARKSAPASVLVRCGALTQTPTLSGLSISDYSSVTGKAGYRATIQTDAATLTSGQANALATEWYQWLLAGETTSLAGLPAIQPNGWYGAAEWVLRRDDCGLRLLPAPLDFGHSSGSDAATAAASLNSQNTDGTEVDSTTTDLRFNKSTGSQITQSGGISTHTLLAAGVSQMGAVTTTTQSFAGDKTFTGDVTVNDTLDVKLASGAAAIRSVCSIPSAGFSAADLGLFRLAGDLGCGFYVGFNNSTGDGTSYAYWQDGLANENIIIGINPTNQRRGILFSGSPPLAGGTDATWDLYKEPLSPGQPLYCNLDFEFNATGIGPVVRSPNGNRWRLGVSNAGAVTVTGPL